MEKHPDLEKLILIRAKLEEEIGSSNVRYECQNGSKMVEEELGYKQVFGVFKPPIGHIKEYSHHWNYDKKRRLYLDITADQFLGIEEKVLVTNANENFYYERYYFEFQQKMAFWKYFVAKMRKNSFVRFEL